jgi:hypothetical protein
MAGHRRGSYGSYDAGHQAAKRHIEEAKRLSHELGGTDKDVKNYFFTLSNTQLASILKDYGKLYGRGSLDYAIKTMPKWRSGRTQMSGLVASRLYNLLPPRMPMSAKYELVKTLWGKYSPHSHKVLTIGSDANPHEVMGVAEKHILDTIKEYSIPDPLQKRFKWLAGDDVGLQQQLLNHFLELEKKQAVEAIRVQQPIMLKHINQSNDSIHHLSQTVEIGSHRFDLVFSANESGVQLENPQPYRPSVSEGSDWGGVLWWIAGIVFLIILLSS